MKIKQSRMRICPICNEGFKARTKNQIFCSDECRKKGRHKQQNEYWKEMWEVAIDIGNCSHCFKERDDLRYKMCSKCRKNTRDRYVKLKMEKLK